MNLVSTHGDCEDCGDGLAGGAPGRKGVCDADDFDFGLGFGKERVFDLTTWK